MNDTLIVGAGIIGLLTALEWVKLGAKVTILDKGKSGSEASWAGGGIVSPLYPWRYPAAVSALSSQAMSSYLDLAESLKDTTGIDPEFNPCGLLMVRIDDADKALEWAEREKRNIQGINSKALYEMEEQLAPDFDSALWMPDVGNIRNPRLLQALRKSLQVSGKARFVENCEVMGLKSNLSQVNTVVTNQGDFSADQFVLATGAWTRALLESCNVKVAIEPVRGQMMVFKAQSGLLKHIVLCDGRYVIPRKDGRILVGSTLEHVGFDKSITEVARKGLLDAAVAMIPQLGKLPIEKHWAGLRPGSPEGIPVISKVPDFDNLFVNAGHFRNGLVLAPSSVRLMMDLMLGREPFVDPEPYKLRGF